MMTDDETIKSPHLPSWEWLEQMSRVDGKKLCVRVDGAERTREFMVEVEEVDTGTTLPRCDTPSNLDGEMRPENRND